MREPNIQVLHGNCLDVLPTLADCSVDSIVTDPPYGLEFMGKDWDTFKTGRASKYKDGGKLHDPAERRDKGGAGPSYVNRPAKRCSICGKQAWSGSPCKCENPEWVMDNSPLLSFQAWCEQWAAECLRVLKPGGHLLAFGGTRTYHRMACAIEDAGFEIRDSIHWTYASGFPKSLSVHKATMKLVESRYAENRCHCLDRPNGCVSGDRFGRESGEDAEPSRGQGSLSTHETWQADVQIESQTAGSAVPFLREDIHEETQRHQEISETVLLASMRGRGTETQRLGDTSLWDGVEEQTGGNSEEGQDLPSVRRIAEGSGQRIARPSHPAVQVRGDKQAGESSGSMRLMPSQDRVGDDIGAGSVADQREPRRLRLDDNNGWKDAVCWVCSWCGLPDRDYLESLKPLGTSLKPAHEPVLVARKPLVGTVAGNVLLWGTGALNIDASRIGFQSGEYDPNKIQRQQHSSGAIEGAFGASALIGKEIQTYKEGGRWPANVVFSHHEDCQQVGVRDDEYQINRLEEWSGFGQKERPDYEGSGRSVQVGVWECVEGCPVQELDQQSGISKSQGGRIGKKSQSTVSVVPAGQFEAGDPGYGDSGGASRFFYCAKPSRRERNAGLDHLDERHPSSVTGRKPGSAGAQNGGYAGMTETPRANVHPTVKPLALMRYLVRLVTPPGGTVLEPFAGSGTTLMACILERFNAIGIEMTDEYLPIIEGRVAWAYEEAAKQTESDQQELPL